MHSLSRRTFLAQSASAAYSQSARPNILFCIADDHSYPHASAYGSSLVRTPNFDRVAKNGILFHNAFVSTPSCCPSRASVLTGQEFYRLAETSMNHTVWPRGLEGYPDLLARTGFATGFTGKGWGPGVWKNSGRSVSPAGPEFNSRKLTPASRYISPIDYAANFAEFLEKRPPGSPFCFWAGFIEPHREFEPGSSTRPLADIEVPGFLPDAEPVRRDLADYALEIEWYDRQLGIMLNTLESRGELANTLVVVTADNGMAFPRAKANLYDFGTRMPLAMQWPARVPAGRSVHDFVRFPDLAPTFLKAAGLDPPSTMTGRSLMPVLTSTRSGQIEPGRDAAVMGIERHFPGSRPDGAGYPCRAIRTRDYLYIRNLTPDRSPAGDRPGPVWPDDDPTGGYGDADGGLSKTYLCRNREKHPELFQLAFGHRPAEELYAVHQDPYNLKDLADEPTHGRIKARLAAKLDNFLKQTKDPRVTGQGADLDKVMRKYPVLGANGSAERR
jgi:uncharacterized sulfatase